MSSVPSWQHHRTPFPTRCWVQVMVLFSARSQDNTDNTCTVERTVFFWWQANENSMQIFLQMKCKMWSAKCEVLLGAKHRETSIRRLRRFCALELRRGLGDQSWYRLGRCSWDHRRCLGTDFLQNRIIIDYPSFSFSVSYFFHFSVSTYIYIYISTFFHRFF